MSDQFQDEQDQLEKIKLKSTLYDRPLDPTNLSENLSDMLAKAENALSVAAVGHDPLLGKILGGHYQLESVLGSGGMSVVYKARHLLLNKYVAVKVISRERAGDIKALQRMLQEAKAAATVSHPNIVGAKEFGLDENSRPYIVMDLVEGESLAEALTTLGKIEPARAFEILAQVCDGLAHAHSKGIVHRDIKPGNIMLTKESGREVARILDFGIAKMTNPGEGKNLTQTGEVFGSPMYMSPEQCLGQKLDLRSDIYSLGCVIHEMFTGKTPFSGEGSLPIILKHIDAAPELDPYLPRYIEKVILKSLERDANKRYQLSPSLPADLRQLNKLWQAVVEKPASLQNAAVGKRIRCSQKSGLWPGL